MSIKIIHKIYLHSFANELANSLAAGGEEDEAVINLESTNLLFRIAYTITSSNYTLVKLYLVHLL